MSCSHLDSVTGPAPFDPSAARGGPGIRESDGSGCFVSGRASVSGSNGARRHEAVLRFRCPRASPSAAWKTGHAPNVIRVRAQGEPGAMSGCGAFSPTTRGAPDARGAPGGRRCTNTGGPG